MIGLSLFSCLRTKSLLKASTTLGIFGIVIEVAGNSWFVELKINESF